MMGGWWNTSEKRAVLFSFFSWDGGAIVLEVSPWIPFSLAAATGFIWLALTYQRGVLAWASKVLRVRDSAGKPILHDDLGALKRNPGNGEAAARLIASAQTFEKAVSIFNDFKLAPIRIAEELPYVTMAKRLQAEDRTPAAVDYLGCENDEDDYVRYIDEWMHTASEKAPHLPAILEREAIEMMNALRWPPKNSESEDG